MTFLESTHNYNSDMFVSRLRYTDGKYNTILDNFVNYVKEIVAYMNFQCEQNKLHIFNKLK